MKTHTDAINEATGYSGGLWLIQRNDGAFVAPPGSERSYTRNVMAARLFNSRQDAERNVCPENETVICWPVLR